MAPGGRAGPVPALPPAAAAQAATSISAAVTRVDNPAAGIDSLAASRADSALRAGVSPQQATRASDAFGVALARQMARGVPMDQALARAEAAFQAEAAVPSPRTPADAAARSFASGAADLARSIDAVAGVRTPTGNAAFERAMAAALARGTSLEQAMGAATAAARASEAAAVADATPQATLAGVTEPAQLVRVLPPASPAFDRALSQLIARGLSPAEALARAQRAAADAAQAERGGAGSPLESLTVPAPATSPARDPARPGFDRALGTALARGLSPQEALTRAAEIERMQQTTARADAASPDNAFVRVDGATQDQRASPVYDQALAVALARGLAPAQAVEQARRTEAQSVEPAPLARVALASGVGVTRVLPEGGSKTFRAALNSALARGVPVDRAVESARRAEAQNAFRFNLPPALARQVAAQGRNVKITTGDGKPLPGWLRFDAQRGQFFAVEVPEGGLPLPLTVDVGGRRVQLTVSESPPPR
jgi:hypothetical protein